jgi:hypothetical protein
MLHQPVENYYRVWRGVPGLDDVAEVENEVVLDESRIVDDESTLEMSMMGGDVSMADCIEDGEGDGDVMVRSRGSSVCSESGSESGESRSLSSSMHHQSHGMDVCMAVSMTETESLGIGLLAEKEREMEKHRGRGLDSRAQSMVSDCSLEDDRSHSISLSPHGHRNVHENVHDVHSPVFRALSSSSLPHVPSFSQFTSLMGGGNNLRDLGDQMDEGTPYKGVSGVSSLAHLADGGWPVPERRPRQYSVGSTGSW